MPHKITWASVTDQPLTEQEQRLVEEVYERLDVFEQACRPFHEEAKVVREIIRLRDPFQDAPDAKEKTLQLQTLKSTFNNCVADQMHNMPEAKLIPETSDQAEAVEDLQDLVHHVIYEVNDYESIHRRRAEDLYGPGTVVTQVAWDQDMSYGKGDIAIIRWPIESFLWDPQASDIQDARAVIKISWHPMSWYEEHYPDHVRYINGEEGLYNEVGMPEIQQENDPSDEDRAMLLEYWYRTYDAKTRRYKINVAYCAGGALLEHHENVYMHGMYPFVIDVHSTIEGSMVGEGLVSELTPMMRYINRYAHYIDVNLRMSSKGRILTRRSSNIDREALADWSTDLIEGDSVEMGQDWAWMQHAPFNGMIANQMLQFQSDLKQDSGANQFTRGETTNNIVSGKAITALQTAGGKIQQLRTSVMNAGFKAIVKQILWLMAEFYGTDRVTMVVGKNGQTRSIESNAAKFFGKKGRGAVTPPPYTVQVEITSRDPARIDSMNSMYMQAYTMAAQAKQYFPLSALFQIMNIEGKDRLLPVIQEHEQTQNMLNQLQSQNEQLMQQLENLQKENGSLRMSTAKLSNALSGAGGINPQAAGMKVAQAGGGPATNAALADRARMELTGKTEMPV